MDKLRVRINNNKEVLVDRGTSLYEIVKENKLEKDIPVILGKLNKNYHELSYGIKEDGDFEAVDMTNSVGHKAYARTLQFVLIKSVLDLFSDAKITIEHSISKGLFGEIHKKTPLSEDDITKIKRRMEDIINKDICIKKIYMKKEEAIKIFSDYKMDDKVKLLKHISADTVEIYELDGRYDYFYGPMAYSTGVLRLFDLVYYEPGFLLRYPTDKDPFNISKFVEHRKLKKIFYETEQWGNILDVADVGSLNDKVESGEIIEILRIAEALHEKKIAYIADMISERPDTKIVLIAGPSSSGKTTFARRLGIQLRVNGLMPMPLGLDDYFVDREHTPRDEQGNYDFESIYALDLDLFNKNLEDILKGKEIEIPKFNFKNGVREWKGKKIKLPKNGILIIEGIHGLNEMLTASIPVENKFKIYISALTQLNLDSHNRIETTDVRIIRRIVRDYLYRGYAAEDTLQMWPSIRRGEEKNIFVFQENADVMFNSTLIYELCVLKQYALKELEKVETTSEVYCEALRLKSFLGFFKDIDKKFVPENSILREFIGGSCFHNE